MVGTRETHQDEARPVGGDVVPLLQMTPCGSMESPLTTFPFISREGENTDF